MRNVTKLALAASLLSVPLFGAVGASASPSACGAAHGAFANVNENFGFLGELGGTPGYHNGATGQEAGATGANNSSTDCQG